jgi:hypothetical protein
MRIEGLCDLDLACDDTSYWLRGMSVEVLHKCAKERGLVEKIYGERKDWERHKWIELISNGF